MKNAKNTRLHVWELALLLALAAAILWGAASLSRQEDLGRKVIRLHVIANSDSPEDQALKLSGTGCWPGPRSSWCSRRTWPRPGRS